MSYNSFEEMPVWRKAMDMAVEIFYLTEGLPRREDYSLTSQIRCSALSVPGNIAEGFGRRHINSRGNFNGPVNLGNPDEVSILELAKTIIELTGSRSKIIFKPLPADDPKHRQPVITLAEEKLGWTPRIPFEEGLSKTIAFFDGLLKNG